MDNAKVEAILFRIEMAAIAHQHSQILDQIICELIDDIRKEIQDDKAD